LAILEGSPNSTFFHILNPTIFHIFDIWINLAEKKRLFVNVENVGAKRTSMLPHGPTNSHLTKENQHLN
jgi:hypothetical protein